ncbi:glycosyltransferase, group 1 family protein [Streptococcus oralis SK1074]|uniref:glycosyltransferase family 4 protein n=1 Tax=Streptococcus oralis TaxID=1303 RepID=UPI00025AA8A3|nr:glycosyltransferase family 4 protein [Streptococcus oralis]EID26631.1 glycosyltransferase, group 1 family protein [Streptococcus oralis SK1074]
MKITFCLPLILKNPAGGYKIVFEYANRLVERSHDVTIVFLTDANYTNTTKSNILKKLLGTIELFNYPKWFELDKKVKKIATPYLDGRDFPEAEVVFATSLRTSFIVQNLSYKKGRKFYLIQGFENWSVSDDEVFESYKLGLRNIVISKWLEGLVRQYDKNVKLISNAIATDQFYIEIPIESRNPYSISMLYHENPQKGFDIAFKAIKLVKQKYSNVSLHLFGVPKRPDNLESWILYTEQADINQLRGIYNKSSIYVCASRNDGFGLTGAESMACGCALASTAFQGVFEYAKDNENALLSPVNDIDALAENIMTLIDDEQLRFRIAKQGSKDITKHSWDRAIDQMEKALKERS